MSWGRIQQGVVRVQDSIEKCEHGQISHRNRQYRIKTSFKSGGDTNVKWGVLV